MDLDSVGGRHPLAQGRLSLVMALAWVVGLSTLAPVIAALLNWVCVALFITAALLQVAYCRLATVTPYKFLNERPNAASGGSPVAGAQPGAAFASARRGN